MEKGKDYEIVQGNGKDLKISNTETHINDLVNKKKKNPKDIVIPKTKEKESSDENLEETEE